MSEENLTEQEKLDMKEDMNNLITLMMGSSTTKKIVMVTNQTHDYPVEIIKQP